MHMFGLWEIERNTQTEPLNELEGKRVKRKNDYLKEALAGFSILKGSTSSTHSFGVDFMRSQRATSAGVESIHSTKVP